MGPTQDDLTREGIANALGETPVVQDEIVRDLERYFQQCGQEMPSRNIKQAHLIPSAQFLPNPNGTAPGWWVERDHRVVVAMPGPPVEMHYIWEQEVEPRLRQLVENEVTVTRNIKTMGLSEAAVGRGNGWVFWAGQSVPGHLFKGRRDTFAHYCSSPRCRHRASVD
ncbi:hypothetical protein C2W62_12055 [Candidatus Entotheonella serta]|nr:hypothetical protein C2W62_12055 [Candidatus Entotheonella serta]